MNSKAAGKTVDVLIVLVFLENILSFCFSVLYSGITRCMLDIQSLSFIASSPTFELIFALIQRIICYFLPFYIYDKVSKNEFDYSVSFRGKNSKYTFLLFLAVYYLSRNIGSIITVFADIVGYEAYQYNLSSYSVFDFVLWAVTLSIVVPLIEEYVFRKFMLERLAPHGKMLAVFVSSLIFACGHAFDGIGIAFVCGVCFSFIALYTGSIKPTIIIHSLNNFLSCILLIIGECIDEQIYYLISLALGAIITFAGFIVTVILAHKFGKAVIANRGVMPVVPNLPFSADNVHIRCAVTPIFILFLTVCFLNYILAVVV